MRCCQHFPAHPSRDSARSDTGRLTGDRRIYSGASETAVAEERKHSMACVRILIADDHELVRQGLRALLASRPTWEVCGEATDGVEAIEKAAELQPDVVLLDISMPRLSGLQAAALIRRESPASEIVIVSQHDPAEMLPSALEAGARGYVSKSEVGSNLLSLIESIVQPASPRANENGATTQVAAAARRGARKIEPQGETKPVISVANGHACHLPMCGAA